MKINIWVGIILCMLLLILPAAASDFTLEIFGNANEDDTINMQDLTYTEQIILEYKDGTQLADAKYDGEVDILDVTQIELIILGREKELTFIDGDGETATVHKPIERIVVAYDNHAEVLRVLGAKDRVVGVDDMISKFTTFFPDLAKKPCVGSRFDLDVEVILELEPDIVIMGSRAWHTPKLEDRLRGTGIDVVRLGLSDSKVVLSEMKILGYILDEEENARIYSEWQNEYLNTINERVSAIPEDEKARVFLDRPGGTTCGGESSYSKTFERAGGINIAVELDEYPKVDPEWVIEQNPDVIIGISFNGGYETDDVSIMKTRYDEVIRTPGFEYVNAVKNDRVYVTHYIILLGPGYHIGVTYLAKWLYPDLFEDLDPQAVHQEYIDRFQGTNYDLNDHGVIVYLPN